MARDFVKTKSKFMEENDFPVPFSHCTHVPRANVYPHLIFDHHSLSCQVLKKDSYLCNMRSVNKSAARNNFQYSGEQMFAFKISGRRF